MIAHTGGDLSRCEANRPEVRADTALGAARPPRAAGTGRRPRRLALACLAAICALGLAAGAAGAQAAEPEWTSDRPSITNSPAVLPPSALALEAGLSYTGVRVGSRDVLTVPIKLRYGIAERVELQLGWEPFGYADAAGRPGIAGLGDGLVGGRFSIADGEGALPALALELGTELPAATRRPELGSGKPNPFAFLSLELAPLGWATLGLNAGVVLEGRRGEHRTFVAQEFVSGLLTLEVAGTFYPFAELAWFATHRDGDGDVALAGLGGVYRLTPRLSVDAALFLGLTSESPDLTLSAGFALLFGP
ncbi:MAG: hypothetical protein KatS3mg102_2922 [Planctomycetota bacterium]|nr:MAG: hypothetical protein KatS3mg102_2922 [Planctomycetota bacterium]